MSRPDRFWARVRMTDTCWLWEGNLNSCGYGRLRIDGALVSAHRRAYTLVYGALPPDAIVRHICGERSCCRPDHLEALSVTRLTPEQRDAVRHSFLGSVTLSRRLGVSDRHIRRLRSP